MPVAEPTTQPSTTISTEPTTSQPEQEVIIQQTETPTEPAQKPERETIIVTTVIENIEEVHEAQKQVTEVEEKSEDNTSLMILIPAVAVVILLGLAIAMLVRCYMKKKQAKEAPLEAIMKVKTDVVEVEPQFVLENDESKNIFARSSHALALHEDIEKTEMTKPGSQSTERSKKKRAKKVVLRKATPGGSNAGMIQTGPIAENEEEHDDGFQNHDNFSPEKSHSGSSPNSTAKKFFNSTNRSNGSMFSMRDVDTTRKLKQITLHNVDQRD